MIWKSHADTLGAKQYIYFAIIFNQKYLIVDSYKNQSCSAKQEQV